MDFFAGRGRDPFLQEIQIILQQMPAEDGLCEALPQA